MRLMLPFAIFLMIVVILFKGMSLHPSEVPSPLINQTAPEFNLPTLTLPTKWVNKNELLNHVTLLNVWASWCVACEAEHLVLMKIAEDKHIRIWGLNYKDNIHNANEWLQNRGNPYQVVLMDADGSAAIDWGVYGTPETFLIDKKGIIRYKQIGAITEDNWNTTLKPMIQTLENES